MSSINPGTGFQYPIAPSGLDGQVAANVPRLPPNLRSLVVAVGAIPTPVTVNYPCNFIIGWDADNPANRVDLTIDNIIPPDGPQKFGPGFSFEGFNFSTFTVAAASSLKLPNGNVVPYAFTGTNYLIILYGTVPQGFKIGNNLV